MKISRFIHVLDQNRIWNSLTKEVMVIDNDLFDYINNNKNNDSLINIPEKLLNLKIVVSEEEEKELIKELITQTTDKYFQGLYLITSTQCNLDCDYCFYRASISGSLSEKKLMSVEIAKKAIDKFKKIVENNPKDNSYWQQVTFYGGEPMTNKKLLKEMLPYAKEMFDDKYSDIVINTNLTLLDNDIANILKDNKIIVQVSLDGNEKMHDLHRKTLDNSGTYKTVLNNAKKLIQMGVEVIPMITATNDNVDNFSEIVLEILESLELKDFCVNVLISGTYDVKKTYFSKLASELVRLKNILNNRNIYGFDFESEYDSIIGNIKGISRNSCGTTRKITVFPNGSVYSCQALQKLDINSMGMIDDNFVNNKNWELWKKRNKFSNEECLDCEVVASCGGGCALGSYNSTNSVYKTDYNQCQFNKELFKILKKEIKH